MAAIAFAAISSLEVIYFGENDVAIFGKVVIFFIEFICEGIHIADRQSSEKKLSHIFTD
jgi:hypothetical protein